MGSGSASSLSSIRFATLFIYRELARIPRSIATNKSRVITKDFMFDSFLFEPKELAGFVGGYAKETVGIQLAMG